MKWRQQVPLVDLGHLHTAEAISGEAMMLALGSDGFTLHQGRVGVTRWNPPDASPDIVVRVHDADCPSLTGEGKCPFVLHPLDRPEGARCSGRTYRSFEKAVLVAARMARILAADRSTE